MDKADVGDLAKSAVKAGNLVMLARAIEHGMGRANMAEAEIEVGVGGSSLAPGLFAAAIKGSKQCLQLFIDLGMDLDVRDEKGVDAACFAAVNNRGECLAMLLEAGAGRGLASDVEGSTNIMACASYGQAECLALLVKKGFDMDAVDKSGRSALVRAIEGRHFDCAKVLVGAGAKLERGTLRGHGPLMIAVIDGQKDVVELLVEAGANVNAVNEHGWTPTMYAVQGAHQEKILEVLLAAGADVDARNEHGWTAAMLAIREDQPEMLCVLAKAGANLAYAEAGHMPAFTTFNWDAQENVIEGKIDPGCCVMLAARLGHVRCMEVLMAAGANANPTSARGITALMRAAASGSMEVVELLIRHGADIEARNNRGEDAADMARYKNKGEMQSMLRAMSQAKREARELSKQAGESGLGGQPHKPLRM